ncbi:hypothetical protein KI387_004074, partial [Taxus chinensis]
ITDNDFPLNSHRRETQSPRVPRVSDQNPLGDRPVRMGLPLSFGGCKNDYNALPIWDITRERVGVTLTKDGHERLYPLQKYNGEGNGVGFRWT